MSHYMEHVRGHVEVFDENHKFVVSADTTEEALRELEIILIEDYKSSIKSM